MRPLVILVADGTMQAVFRAFFRRERFADSLGCGNFDFSPNDVVHDPRHTDGGVHLRCQELLRPFLQTHQRALVVLDRQFGGELPALQIRAEMLQRLQRSGWQDRVDVIVIDPELEVWLWQDNPHISRFLRYSGNLRADMTRSGDWASDAPKPHNPKDLFARLIRAGRAGTPMAVYSAIAGNVSIKGCIDPSFLAMRDRLRVWFPAGPLD